jgi:hypothetical protein
MRKPLLLSTLGVIAALSACSPSSTQTASVVMNEDGCIVSPTSGFHDGMVTFTVENDGMAAATFTVRENGKEPVGSVVVDTTGATRKLTVRLDAYDKYVTTCGKVPGPELGNR